MSFLESLADATKAVFSGLAPPAPGIESNPAKLINALVTRTSLSSLFSYRAFLPENNLIELEEGNQIGIGFVCGMSPVLVAGMDLEAQVKSFLDACPPKCVVQQGVMYTSQVDAIIEAWRSAESQNGDLVLSNIAQHRADTYLLSSRGRVSMQKNQRMHPRQAFHWCSVKIYFKGSWEKANALDRAAFISQILAIREKLISAMEHAHGLRLNNGKSFSIKFRSNAALCAVNTTVKSDPAPRSVVLANSARSMRPKPDASL